MTRASTGTALPLYAQLKADLSAAISRGELKFGDQLPSQRALSERYEVSHMTVRRAISELLNAGVIYSIPGKGLYVAEQKEQAESGPLVSFTEDMAERGMTASSKTLAADVVPATTALATMLEVPHGARLVCLRRLRFAEGEPMALQTTYLVYRYCPGLLAQPLEQGSLYATLRNVFHLNLADSTVFVEAEMADAEQAALLGLTMPAALVVTEQVTYLNTGQPVEYARSIYRGDRYRIRLR